jgi:tetratricopeptide (TPR) repeat protein
MRRKSMAALALGALAVDARARTGPSWPATHSAHSAGAPLFDGLGPTRVADASPSALARRYVAQGLVWAWSFNPAEAARSFGGAVQVDAACAAGWWGLAWSLGPTINSDLDPADAPRLHDAMARARRLREQAVGVAPRWRELIDALALRHPDGRGTAVDETAYEQRMAALHRRHGDDADIATLAAEALMNLHPYDWWQRDGRARPWTAAIAARLRHALRLDPRHPGANHAWVHLMETSPHPERADAAAERLRTLVPGSPHLLHMPSHIDLRRGRFAAAVQANERAIAADQRYLEQVDAEGAYRVGYVAHNHHFLWAAASMQGAGALAVAAADAAWPAACAAGVPERGTRAAGTVAHFAALPALARLRFGRWDELLERTPPPDGNEPYAIALWHHARATAALRLGRLDALERERSAFDRAAAEPAAASLRIKSVHAASALLEIARLTLAADIALAAGGAAAAGQALDDLQRCVAIEDDLEPDEPHLWLAPTRQALGAAQLAAGRPAAAARSFELDLRHYPDNGWSLAGLARALRELGRASEAAAVAVRGRSAWRNADIDVPVFGRL